MWRFVIYIPDSVAREVYANLIVDDRKGEKPMICPACEKMISLEAVLFCPFCGEKIATAASASSVEERNWLQKIKEESNPIKKHKLIETGIQICPNSLPLHEEALFLGRLYMRDGKKLDFSLIKCHLLYMYLTPENFSDKKKHDMRNELFHDAELETCITLSGNEEQYLRKYLRQLSKQFTELFLCGSTYYTKTIFGFRIDQQLDRVLAKPAAQMIAQMLNDEVLTKAESSILSKAFLQGFSDAVGNDSYLKQELDKINVNL